jgi:P-type conjugative transfer protein TrbJ
MLTSGKTWMGIFGLTALLVIWPTTGRGQFDAGGGIIVFDPSNFTKNTITAAQMIKQVLNSTKEVELMVQNLIQTGGAWDDILVLFRRLDEVIATGDALHYQLTDLDQRMQERYPGFAPPGEWWPAYQRWTMTSLDTLRGTLNTVHEQLTVAERLREEALLASLRAKTESAAGNLDVSQTGNMIDLQIIEELRKVRQLLGAFINAQNVAQAHEINLMATAQRVEHDLLENSVFPIPTQSQEDSIHLFAPIR